MNAIKQKRRELGMTQQQLAEVLGITRSALSMIELGQRPLYPHLYDKLNELKASVDQPSQIDANVTEALEAFKVKSRAKLERMIFEKEHELEKAQFRLSEMREKYPDAEKFLKVICEEMQNFQSLPSYFKRLQKMYSDTLKTLLATCPEAQQILGLRINTLIHFLAEARVLISK